MLPKTHWGENASAAKDMLIAAANFSRLSAAQQRLLSGDVSLPILRALIARDLELLKSLKQARILNEEVPVVLDRPDQIAAFEVARNRALCALGANKILATNLLMSDLVANIGAKDSVPLIAVALSSKGASNLLPPRWLKDWNLEWRANESQPGGGWVAHIAAFSPVFDLSAKQTKCVPEVLDILLPSVNKLLRHEFLQSPMLWALEGVSSAASRERMALSLGSGQLPGTTKQQVLLFLTSGLDPTLLESSQSEH